MAEAKAAAAKVRSEAEAHALLAKVPSSHKLICLDRGGDQLGSEEFARVLAEFRDDGAQGLAFLIGGGRRISAEQATKTTSGRGLHKN